MQQTGATKTDAGSGFAIGFVGCGNMARALVEGMLASGDICVFAYAVQVMVHYSLQVRW